MDKPRELPSSQKTTKNKAMLNHQQRGASLIEVLVSILLITTGIFGLVALQAKAVSMSIDAENRNRAALLMNEFVNITQIRGELPNGDALAALEDLAQKQTMGGLPDGKFIIKKIDDSTAYIILEWTHHSVQDENNRTARYSSIVVY